MAEWYDVESARDDWADAPESDDALELLLEHAQTAIETYAPALPDDQPAGTIPAGWRIAQLRHARNVFRSEYSGDAGSVIDNFATESFALPARFRDLDASIRELLRPRRVFGGPVG